MNQHRGVIIVEIVSVVVFLIALAAVVFFVVKPQEYFAHQRDSERFEDVVAIGDAAVAYSVDFQGRTIAALYDMPVGRPFMIGTAENGCQDMNAACHVDVENAADCIDLKQLVDEGYLDAVPVAPKGTKEWSESYTGYYVIKHPNEDVSFGACEPEINEDIEVLITKK